MTIATTDIKLRTPERLTDLADGGGRQTSGTIVDGQLNNLFQDTSRLDRVTGRVSLRKAYMHVDTANVDPGTRDALFRRAKQAAGIADLHWHDLRHEAATRLARKLDVLDLARMTGHRDPKSLLTYYNPTAAEIAKRLG